MSYVKEGWLRIKKDLESIDELYSFEETKKILSTNGLYKNYFGRSKNRTMIKDNPVLYNSIMYHSNILEDKLKSTGRYRGYYNFKYRMMFIVEMNGEIENLRCKCGRSYTWNTYCRYCPEYHKTWVGRRHTKETRKKQRVSALAYIEKTNGQVAPRYNIDSISVIEEYGKKYGYNFQHAENGGEVQVAGYFVDGYDEKNNVVIEIDESHHYDSNGTLRNCDLYRQREIEEELGCTFIRVRI